MNVSQETPTNALQGQAGTVGTPGDPDPAPGDPDIVDTVSRYHRRVADCALEPFYLACAQDDLRALTNVLAPNPTPDDIDRVCRIAACAGSERIIARAFEAGWWTTQSGPDVLYYAVAGRQVALARRFFTEWGVGGLRNVDCILRECCVIAAFQADWQMLAWLSYFADGDAFNPREGRFNYAVYIGAIYGNRSDVVEWAHRRGIAVNDCVRWNAARYGRLWFLRWTKEALSAWRSDFAKAGSADLTSAATLGGHIDVLIWLRCAGCQWAPDCWYQALNAGHFHVLKYLAENGCPMGTFPRVLVDELNWLHSRGFVASAEDVVGSDLSPDDQAHLLKIIGRVR